MNELAQQIAESLKRRQQKIVFAESCTAGLVAATMATVPGVSSCLCGSIVTYRESMKSQWLGVRETTLAQHSAVSDRVTMQMAAGVITRTSEADIAAAVTGHLGPDAPPDFDGTVFVAIATRGGDDALDIQVKRHSLGSTNRENRQREAVRCVLSDLIEMLNA